MTYVRLSSPVCMHTRLPILFQAELSVYTPLSLRVQHSTRSQLVGHSTIDLSCCACETASASALHLKPQPQSFYGCLGLINYSKSPLQPEVSPHSPLPVAGDTRVVIIHLLNKLWQILQLLAPFSGGVPTQRVQILICYSGFATQVAEVQRN